MTLGTLPGWLQAALTLGVVLGLYALAYLAGAPGSWAPLVIGGALGLATALIGVTRSAEDD